MRCRASAAAFALGLPPSRQSANSKSDCRTGFENATRELSRKVMRLTPQPSSVLATAQPSVPAGSSFREAVVSSAAAYAAACC